MARTEESRHIISATMKERGINCGRRLSVETKRKISENRKGKTVGENHPFYKKHHSELSKQKMSESKKGNPSSMLGKRHSEEAKQKMSLSHKGQVSWNKGKFGVESHCWQGGLSFEPYSTEWTKTLKRAIRERDHYICQLCLNEGYPIHHIDYDKKNCNPKNLITLCVKCHAKVNFNRTYWTEYFQLLRGKD